MSQYSSMESPSHSANLPIKPALQAALGGLDVEIDRELARFRREHKRAQPSHLAGNRAANRLGQQGMDLIAIAATSGSTQSQTPTTEAQQTPSALPGFDPFPAGPLALTSTPDPATPPSTPAESNDLATPGIPLASLDANPNPPDNYLESSEQLLNSVPDPSQSRLSGLERRRLRRKNPLLTPLGIGSILLVVLGSATVVYLALNPTRFRSTLARLFNRNEPATTPSSTLPPVAVTPTPSVLPELPKAPNLANQTFAEMNLSTLATLNATPKPAPLPVAPPVVPSVLPSVAIAPNVPTTVNPGEGLENLSTALLPQSSAPPQPTQSTAPNATSSPAPAGNRNSNNNLPPVPNSSRATNTTPNPNLFFVVTNYNGDASLQQARQVVSDAYVRDFSTGKRIQLGTFYTEDQAKVMIEQLKQQGISAQIYKP